MARKYVLRKNSAGLDRSFSPGPKLNGQDKSSRCSVSGGDPSRQGLGGRVSVRCNLAETDPGPGRGAELHQTAHVIKSGRHLFHPLLLTQQQANDLED